MTILDGEGVAKQPKAAEPVADPNVGAIFIHPHAAGRGILVGDGAIPHPGASAAPLDHFSMQRVPNGGWIIARGDDQPFLGAFSSFDEAVAWLKQKVAK